MAPKSAKQKREEAAARARGRMGLSDYARHRGVTRKAVYDARDRGVIQVADDHTVDVEAADAAWAANILPEPEQLRRSRGAEPVAADEGEAGTAETYTDAHTRREIALADRAELDLAQRRGELVSAEAVKRQWFTLARGLRERLMGLSASVVPLVRAAPDQPAARRIMDDKIRAALQALADEAADGEIRETEQGAADAEV